MAKYFYTKTVTYTLALEADSAEEADRRAEITDVTQADSRHEEGWQEDGYDD